MRILVTGSEGLVGKPLTALLTSHGIQVRRLDVNFVPHHPDHGNVLDSAKLQEAAHGCSGIVHLAGVSRVIQGEQNPDLCWRTNFMGTQNVLHAACTAKCSWVLYASSREVYGNQNVLPVKEDCLLEPINIYGRSKAAAEELIMKVRSATLNTAVVRYSNVYGSITDYPDRVIPAFCRAAATGDSLRVDGARNTFDFTHITDVTDGTLKIIDKLIKEDRDLPPFHLTTGRATSLREAAELANAAGGNRSTINEASSRTFDVANFCGDPRQTMVSLDWRPKVTIEDGIRQLVGLFKEQLSIREPLVNENRR